MEVVDTAQINSFAPIAAQTDFAQTSEEAVFIFTSGQLQEIIARAIQPLQDEVMHLRATVARQGEKIAALEATLDTHADNSLIQLRLINSLREDVHPAAAPAPTRETTQKTQDHITSIAVILAAKEKRLIESQTAHAYVTRLRKEGMTFSELANIMGLTVDRIRQLSRIAATDQRFNITWHPRKKNTKIIKLRRWDALGL